MLMQPDLFSHCLWCSTRKQKQQTANDSVDVLHAKNATMLTVAVIKEGKDIVSSHYHADLKHIVEFANGDSYLCYKSVMSFGSRATAVANASRSNSDVKKWKPRVRIVVYPTSKDPSTLPRALRFHINFIIVRLEGKIEVYAFGPDVYYISTPYARFYADFFSTHGDGWTRVSYSYFSSGGRALDVGFPPELVSPSTPIFRLPMHCIQEKYDGEQLPAHHTYCACNGEILSAVITQR